MIIDNPDLLKLCNRTIQYNGKSLTRWWGKTYFYIDSKANHLIVENFSPFVRLLNWIGCFKSNFRPLTFKSIIPQNRQKSLAPIVDKISMLLQLSTIKNLLIEMSNDDNSDERIISFFENGYPTYHEDWDNHPLNLALICKRANVLKYLLDNNVRIEPEIFSHAIELNREIEVSLFLEKGFDVNEKSFLIEAISNHNKKHKHIKFENDKTTQRMPSLRIIDAILKKSDERNCQNALSFAINDQGLTKAILDKGAKLKKINDKDLADALEIQEKEKRFEFVNALIQKGARLTQGRGVYETNIFLKFKDKELIELLINNQILTENEIKATLGLYLLYVRDEQGKADKQFIEYLISIGAELNPHALRAIKPLEIAMEMGDLELMQFLISKGANVNAHDDLEIEEFTKIEDVKTFRAHESLLRKAEIRQDLQVIELLKKHHAK